MGYIPKHLRGSSRNGDKSLSVLREKKSERGREGNTHACTNGTAA